MAANERQLEAVSHFHRIVHRDPRATRRQIQNMALVFGRAIVGADPGQPLVKLPSLLALYLCPWLNNSHQRSPVDSPGNIEAGPVSR